MAFLKLLFGIASIFFTIGFGEAFVSLFRMLDWGIESLRLSAYGFIGFIPVWLIIKKGARTFVTFEHEIAHSLVGFLFLRRVKAIAVVEDVGGETHFDDKVNTAILLAPYFLPTTVLFLLPLYWLIKAEYLPAF
jgi:hypothetical protein